MGPKEWEISSAVRSLVCKIVLPIYLWSIGYKTLNDYIEDILKYEGSKTNKLSTPST